MTMLLHGLDIRSLQFGRSHKDTLQTSLLALLITLNELTSRFSAPCGCQPMTGSPVQLEKLIFSLSFTNSYSN